ncbi:hypothetical protein DNTS_017555 [Danionella cerebrum]|uniref:Specifically androgen-regulated gene protein n=1 Tax=Danionella cerebrum TaxID=2873325 RepID=A0A553RG47_9TELE|nr:hypothetical protein DNTS_017555 [Danionella translucida]
MISKGKDKTKHYICCFQQMKPVTFDLLCFSDQSLHRSSFRILQCAMPKSDSWPGGTAIGSGSGMDSAGSCDSVLSINSSCVSVKRTPAANRHPPPDQLLSCIVEIDVPHRLTTLSEDNLEHLSAEERACLIFLEETIDSLEVEDDSGLSTDEAECPSNDSGENTPQQKKPGEPSVHEDPNRVIGKEHKPSQKHLVPTPLLENGKMLEVIEPSSKDEALIDAPDGFRSSSELQPWQNGLEETPSKVASPLPSIGLSGDVVDLPPSFIPEPPVRAGLINSRNVVLKTLEPISSDVPLDFIPPPSDFMDEPLENNFQSSSPISPLVHDEPPEWIPELPKTASAGSVKPVEVPKSPGPLSHNEINGLRMKASMKKETHLNPIIDVQHSSTEKQSTPLPELVPAVPKEYSDPKSPPAVAPKPKKLPSNIILKSHKDTGTTHSLLPQSERGQMDPHKIRIEALKKLGLLKNEEVETAPRVSPHSPTFKVKSGPRTLGRVTPPVEVVQEEPRLSESPVPVDVLREVLKQSDARTKEGPVKIQSSKSFQIKSATLERTGAVSLSDLGPQMNKQSKTNVELSPGQLRKSRARPTSVGSAKDLGIGQQADEPTKPHNAAPTQAGHDEQKIVPRHNGISVMISPHGQNSESRREALKKLGLLRD